MAETLAERARRRAAELGFKLPDESTPAAAAASPVAAVAFDADLVPEIVMERTEEQYAIDAVISSIDIVDAYNRWCNKMHCDPKGKTESIMVRCPNPAHEDVHKSAWLGYPPKAPRGLGNCEICGGFDQHDLAAWKFGFDVPGYKSKEDFPRLREAMAEDLGYRVMKAGKDEWLEKVAPTETPKPTPSPTPESTTSTISGVTPPKPTPAIEPSTSDSETEADRPHLEVAPDVDDPMDDEPITLGLDWRTLPAVTEGTFLYEWMTVMSQTWQPEEFYLFEGLLALSHAVGNKAVYSDDPDVRGNLMVCLVGTSGSGKSISIGRILKLLHESMPFDAETGGGVRMIPVPGSGEALVDQFDLKHTDATTGTVTVLPVNGLCRDSEMASIMKRIGRNGNTSREVIMDLYDYPTPLSLSSRGAGVVTATDHYMQFITSTQPGSLRRLLTDADAASGFLNRWAFVFGVPKKRPSRGKFRADHGPAIEPLRKVRAWASGGRVVDWHNEDVGIRWDAFFDSRIEPLGLQEESWLVSRMELLTKKLLLLFAINDRSTTITHQHVDTVMAMWDYLLATYGVVEKQVGRDDTAVCMEAIENYLKARPGQSVTVRQLKKQSAARRFGTDLIGKCIDTMSRHGLIQEVPRPKNDRVPRYVYEPDTGTTGATLTVLAGGMR